MTATKNEDQKSADKSMSNRDVIEKLHAKLAQLSAMNCIINGEGLENFDSYNDGIRNDYLWACSDICDEAYSLALQLDY